MKCPECDHLTRVVETSHVRVGVRRRRFCQRDECGLRFTSFEVAHDGGPKSDLPARVVFLDNDRERRLQSAVLEIQSLLGGDQ